MPVRSNLGRYRSCWLFRAYTKIIRRAARIVIGVNYHKFLRERIKHITKVNLCNTWHFTSHETIAIERDRPKRLSKIPKFLLTDTIILITCNPETYTILLIYQFAAFTIYTFMLKPA